MRQRLYLKALETSPNLPPGSVRAELHANGWPSDPATLDNADAIVLFSDGSATVRQTTRCCSATGLSGSTGR